MMAAIERQDISWWLDTFTSALMEREPVPA
jgi:hypothetical protein